MRKAHGRIGLVDVLSTGTTRTVGVDAKILVLNLDVDIVIDLGNDFHRGERGLAALVGIERRDAHEPVNAALGLEHAERVRTFHLEVDILVAGLFALLHVVFLDLPTLILGIALIHAVEHRNPIAGLGAALSGVEFHEDVALIELTAQQRLKTKLAEELVGLRTLRESILECGLLSHALFHFCELQKNRRVIHGLHQLIERQDISPLCVGCRDYFLRLRLVVPEIPLRLLILKRSKPRPTLVDLDVISHLGNLVLESGDSLPHFFRLDEFLLFLLCHFSFLTVSATGTPAAPFHPS